MHPFLRDILRFLLWRLVPYIIPMRKSMPTYCFIPASLIAISRLYLFVHYPTDILGGIFVGIISSYLGIRLVHYIENSRLKNLKNVALTS